jgi:DNA-binding beta-propeller fold protein YncE
MRAHIKERTHERWRTNFEIHGSRSGDNASRAKRTGKGRGAMSARRFTLAVIASSCAVGWGLLLGSPALALNVHVFSGAFSEEGTGAGQLEEPRGVAVNYATHDVYVADRGNDRVEEFSSAGAYLGQFAPPGGFENPTAIAVDNSGNPLDPSAGDVYVADSSSNSRNVIDKFSESGVYEGDLTAGVGGRPLEELNGVAVDAAGTLWIMLHRLIVGGGTAPYIESFTDAQTNVPITDLPGRGSYGPGFTVDAEGRLSYSKLDRIAQLDADGGEREFGVKSTVTGLSADVTTDDLYSGEGEQVTAYDLEAQAIERFGSGHLSASAGLAIDASTGTVYVADGAADRIAVFDQVVVPDVRTGEEPTNIQQEGSVTLDGTVDAHGIALTSCEFEYGTSTSYGSTAACEPSPGSSAGPVEVHANITGLTPLTTYHYRLVAGNANGENDGIDRSFTAGTRASVDAESVFDVSSDGASFFGQVNPGGAETTYRFEYGLTAAYGESVSGDAGSGAADVAVDGHAQGLQASVLYHYRLVAESPLGTTAGEDRTFITQPPPSAAGLPDDRSWELVSPPNKQGAALEPIGGEEGRLIQAAADGSAISYAATGPTEEAPPGNRSPEEVQIFSTRALGGWTTKVIATPHDATHEGDTTEASEYRFFSSDLSLGLVSPVGATSLSEEASERTPYLRHDMTCEANPAGCYQPLLTASNVEAGTKFGGFDVEIRGATPDLSHIVLYSSNALTPGGASGLYEWSAGKLTFLAEMSFGRSGAGKPDERHAISDDGSRVVGNSVAGVEEDLIMRDATLGTTTRLDVTEPGAAGGGESEPIFQTASSDGSRVFFTDDVQLTTDSTAFAGQGSSERKPDLYEYNFATGKVSDLSVPLNGGEHAEVLGDVLGASEDGSYVYFVANGVLALGGIQGTCKSEATTGMCNLYVSHDGATSLVAILSGEDSHSFVSRLSQLTARVSPNGRWLAFMSDRSLTGYDNRDVISDEPDEEVFLYHADPEAGEKQLVCASCDPTGGRPSGTLVHSSGALSGESPPLVNGADWNGRWLAATVPGWTNNTLDTSAYQSRYLSDEGRLFFDSADALAPQDTDGTWDVYEYEPPSSAAQAPPNDTCTAGSPAYSTTSGGCVDLISSGGSHEESVFLDASESGDDVFFLTAAGLSSQDYDGALDVYDAHACSAASPCLPVPAVAPPACSTGDSCKAAPTPQPEIFGAPSSETFSGAGNVTAAEGKVAPKALTKKQKLARALQRCRKKPKRKRAACERQAKRASVKKAAPKSRVAKSVSGRTGR